MHYTKLLILAIAAASPLATAAPLPEPTGAWDKVKNAVTSPKTALVVKTCGLGLAMVGGACVAAANFPHHPGTTVAAAAVGLTNLVPAAQGVAKEWKDAGDKKQKDDLKKQWPDAVQQQHSVKAKPVFDDIKNGNHKPLKHVENPPTGAPNMKPSQDTRTKMRAGHKLIGYTKE